MRGPGPSDRRSNCDHPVRAHGRDGAGSMSADLRLDSWLAEHYPELLVTLLRARERGDFLTVAEIEAAWVRALISAYLSTPKRSRKNSLSISSGSNLDENEQDLIWAAALDLCSGNTGHSGGGQIDPFKFREILAHVRDAYLDLRDGSGYSRGAGS